MLVSGIHKVVDNGRTHLALGKNYKGSVNSYNNGFTQFFANMFGVSMKVKMGNEAKHVNKKSYAKFLNKPLKELHNFTTLNNSDLDAKASKGYMRDAISYSKKRELFEKLAQALYMDNDNEAQMYIGQGADIDRNFWQRSGGYGLTTESPTYGLPSQSFTITCKKYTPLLYVAESGNHKMRDALLDFGAIKFEGETTRIRRKYVGTNVDVVPTTNYIPVGKHIVPIHSTQTVVTDLYKTKTRLLNTFKLNKDNILEVQEVAKKKLPPPPVIVPTPKPAPYLIEIHPDPEFGLLEPLYIPIDHDPYQYPDDHVPVGQGHEPAVIVAPTPIPVITPDAQPTKILITPDGIYQPHAPTPAEIRFNELKKQAEIQLQLLKIESEKQHAKHLIELEKINKETELLKQAFNPPKVVVNHTHLHHPKKPSTVFNGHVPVGKKNKHHPKPGKVKLKTKSKV